MRGRAAGLVERRVSAEEVVFRVKRSGWWARQETELRANTWGLEASGGLGGHGRGVLRIPWTKVAELHYAPSLGGAVAGLYVRERQWDSRCLLPCIGEAEAEQVIGVLAARYAGLSPGLKASANPTPLETVRPDDEDARLPPWRGLGTHNGRAVAASTGL